MPLNVDSLNAGTISQNGEPVKPYKVYTALLTQSGTDAPVATVLENTFEGNITFERLSEGFYRMYLPFEQWGDSLSKVWQPNFSLIVGTRWMDYIPSDDSSTNFVVISNYTTSSVISGDYTLIDGMFKFPIEIRVYN